MTKEIKEHLRALTQEKILIKTQEKAQLKEALQDALDRQDLDEAKMIRGWIRENEQELHLEKEALKIYNEELKDLAD